MITQHLWVLEWPEVRMLLALGVIKETSTEFDAYMALAAIVRDPLVKSRYLAIPEKPEEITGRYARVLKVVDAMTMKEKDELQDRILAKMLPTMPRRYFNSPRP